MPAFTLRRCAAVAAPVLALTGALAVAAPAHAASTTVVVSEAYGGGGNKGAPLRNDFVELFNSSDSPVDLAGWSVAYWSAGAPAGSAPSATTPLNGSIGAGRHYLVQESAGSNTQADALPAPDATGGIAMSGTSARVAVRNAAGQTVDLLGWGDAADSEQAPAPATTNETSSARRGACYDTDNNAVDFTSGAPTPQNTAADAVNCADQPPPSAAEATIAQIQGAGHLSPYKGRAVAKVPGIVDAIGRDGFWMESTTPDGDDATSEGIYVFGRTAAGTVAVGDSVLVDGAVAEYRPGGSSDNLTTTEITGPTVTVRSHGNDLPAPVVIGVDRITPQQTVEAGDPGSVEYSTTTFAPSTNAIDFYESLEGMRVALRDAVAVGPTNRYGELPVVPGQHVDAVRSMHGGVVYGGYDQPNAMRVILTPLHSGDTMPLADVGDHFAGDAVGVLDYNFSNFMLEATSLPELVPGGLQREVTTAPTNNQLAVGTFNVENLAPTNPQSKFDRLAGQVVHNLKSPDILALEEIQDDNGAQDDGVVDSTTTLDKLTTAIRAAGGPAYEARWVDPVNDQDGGQPGGNIRSVFLYQPDRGVTFVDHAPGDATTATGIYRQGNHLHLTHSPGRIDPASSAWTNSRKPLVGEFRFRGQTVFAIANHFASKGGDDPLFGKWQQPTRFSEGQRHQQAQEVRDFVDSLLAADADANVVVLGDLNDFEFSQTADILVGGGSTALTDLPRTLPAPERYTYDYEGNSQVLDHILLSPALTAAPPGAQHPAYVYDVVHTNCEFHDQDSDHDPQVVRLALRGGRG